MQEILHCKIEKQLPPKPPQSTTCLEKSDPSSTTIYSTATATTISRFALTMAPWSDIHSLLKFSAIFCVILIIYGELQDSYMKVKYTDADYIVISNASSLVASGHSPYYRTDYRHSPFFAFLLLPNEFFHRSWGKFIFSSVGITCVFRLFL